MTKHSNGNIHITKLEMYIGYTNEHTGHNERRTSRHDTHTYHHQKTHDWL